MSPFIVSCHEGHLFARKILFISSFHIKKDLMNALSFGLEVSKHLLNERLITFKETVCNVSTKTKSKRVIVWFEL